MVRQAQQRVGLLQGTLDIGRTQLLVEESQWKQMAEAVARLMWPAAEENWSWDLRRAWEPAG